MISLEEARGPHPRRPRAPPPAETVALAGGWSRVLARPVVARLTQPPADVSAMDGYAVRAADAAAGATPRTSSAPPRPAIPSTGAVGAGRGGAHLHRRLRPGRRRRHPAAGGCRGRPTARSRCSEAVERRPLDPPPRPRLRRGRGAAARRAAPDRARHRPGRRGQPSLAGGAPRARASASWRPATRSPCPASRSRRAASSAPTPMPWPRWSAPAAATRWCCRSRPMTATPSPGRGRGARGCDLLVTTGGASVGDHDLVQAALGPEGFALDFWKIAMRPGKPLIWGRLGATPVLGLPGNPVSALVCARAVPAAGARACCPACRPPRRRPSLASGRRGAGGERPPLRPSARHAGSRRGRPRRSPPPSRCRTAPC